MATIDSIEQNEVQNIFSTKFSKKKVPGHFSLSPIGVELGGSKNGYFHLLIFMTKRCS